MSKRKYSSNTLPPRWLNCPRKGGLIAEKLIPFKTPLDYKFDDVVPDECKFNIQMFLASVKSQYKKSVGLIIDLTKTTRFYNKDEVESLGCNYIKLQCEGHAGAPDEMQTQIFIDVVDKFIRQKPLELVGIHCTHGFNRTGFLISAFLVEKMDWSVDAAVHTFAQIRPPGIYKGAYIRELFKRYDDEDAAPRPPVLPDWCNDEGNGLDDDGNLLDEAGPSAKRRREHVKANPTFMEGVGGATAITDQPRLSNIQQRVQDLCGWDKAGFPGAQPVSMDISNMNLMSRTRYMVSWKADGTRYMMLIDGPGSVYLIDRDNCVFHVPNIEFPKRKDLNSHIRNTLLDGELVIDEDKSNRRKTPRYLMYDIVTFEGQKVGGTEFKTRLTCMQRELYEPRCTKIEQGLLNRSKEPFGIRPKPFYDLSEKTGIENVKKLLSSDFTKSLGHETDGLIFQPAGPGDFYKSGRQDDMLKWKPPHLNSVDFKLSIVKIQQTGMLAETKGMLYVGGFERPIGQIKVKKELKQYNNKIIECSWDPLTQSWKFMRERTDKSFPNAYATAVAVMGSIKNPVTEQILLTFIHKSAWRPHSKQQQQQSASSTMPPPPRRT